MASGCCSDRMWISPRTVLSVDARANPALGGDSNGVSETINGGKRKEKEMFWQDSDPFEDVATYWCFKAWKKGKHIHFVMKRPFLIKPKLCGFIPPKCTSFQ